MINGPYLRELRKSQHYTLIQFSQEIGCTASFLSQLERGQKEPSLATLRKLSEVLGVPLASFFLPDEDNSTLSGSAYTLTHKENRLPVSMPLPGVTCEILTHSASEEPPSMNGLFLSIPPHSLCVDAPVSHKNDECIYLLKGELCALLNGEEVSLREGDCLYVHSGTVHNLDNRSDAPCEIFIFCN